MLDKLLGNAIVLQSVMELLDNSLDDENVETLVVTIHVIDLTNLSIIDHYIDGLLQ